MPFDHYWNFSWLDILGHKYNDFYLMVADFFVRSPVKIEAIESSSSSGVKRHAVFGLGIPV
jgi:hypothetical protein